MNLRSPLIAAVCWWFAGCGSFFTSTPRPSTCASDDQCAEGHICFPDGCGNPDENVFLEVTPNSRSGNYAQDFAAPSGWGKGNIDIEVYPPVVLTGELSRRVPSGSEFEDVLYEEPVFIRAQGESELIPGVARTYEVSLTKPERGAYALYLGTGRYTVSAYPHDKSIPPSLAQGVSIRADGPNALNFNLPALQETLIIGGRLLKTRDAASGLGVPITEAPMDIQAFQLLSGRPLSQRVPVSSGLSGSRGDFLVAVDPSANELAGGFTLLATPREPSPTALLPEKAFAMTQPYSTSPIFEMGDFGDPLRQLSGEVLSTNQSPVAGAWVKLEGTVMGGGTFRALPVLTNDAGVFAVDVLPNGPGQLYTATIIPPGDSPAGLLQTQVRTHSTSPLSPMLTPNRFVCPDKVTVTGTLDRPSGEPASAAEVTAVPTGKTQAISETTTVTDSLGRFIFTLDPGEYQLEFRPGPDLPRMSRVVVVTRETVIDGGIFSRALDLGTFKLSRGHLVKGTITARPAQGAAAQPAPYAVVRFFRVAQSLGTKTSLLLAEAVANEKGEYSVVLPTREQ